MAAVDAPTIEFELSRWERPVETKAQLWPFASEGQLCFVKDIARVFVRVGDRWIDRRR